MVHTKSYKRVNTRKCFSVKKIWLIFGLYTQLSLTGLCLSPDTLYSDPLLDGHIVNRYELEEMYPVILSSELTVGDGLDWESNPISTRAFLSFSLDSLNGLGALISSARLRVYQLLSVGDNQSDVFPIFSDSTYSCKIDHITYGDDLDESDWTAGDPGDSRTIQAGFGTISDSTSVGFRDIDVLSCIREDVHSGRPRSQYRLRFEIEHDNDMYNDWIIFSASTYPPAFYTPTIFLEYDSSSSVSQEIESKSPGIYDLRIYPNPTNSEITISFGITNSRPAEFIVYDILGHIVYSETIYDDHAISQSNRVFLSKQMDVKSGIYIIGIRSGRELMVNKVSIIK